MEIFDTCDSGREVFMQRLGKGMILGEEGGIAELGPKIEGSEAKLVM